MLPSTPILLQPSPEEQKLNELRNYQKPGFDSKQADNLPKVSRPPQVRILTFSQNGDQVKLLIKSMTDCNPNDHMIYNLGHINTKLIRADMFLRMGELSPKQYCDEHHFKEYSSYEMVIAISHKWLGIHQPDPEGHHYREVCEYLKRRGSVGSNVGIFMDYVCLPQVIHNGDRIIDRTSDEEKYFRKGLQEMSYIYACADQVFITQEGLDKYEDSTWCQFESTIARLRQSEVMMDPKPLKNSRFRLGMSSAILRQEIDAMISSTRVSNGKDADVIKARMIEFIGKDLSTTDIVKAQEQEMMTLNAEVMHIGFWEVNCGSFNFLEDGKNQLDGPDKLMITEIANSKPCCNPVCTLCNSARVIGMIPMAMCWCCCGVPLAKCGAQLRRDCHGDIDGITLALRNRGLISVSSGTVIGAAQNYTHLITYNIRASNIEEVTKGTIREVYGGFDNFVDKHNSGFIHARLARDLIIMNAIGWEVTDIILKKQVMA